MNRFTMIAAALSAVTLLVHTFIGGSEIHDPVLAGSLSVDIKAVLSVIWHAVTAMLAINTLALGAAAYRPHHQTPLVVLVTAQYLALAALFIFYGLAVLGSLWPMPQWTIFILTASFALAGLYRHPAPGG